jgi:hypothetical protein
MIKYRVYFGKSVEKCEVERETCDSVWLKTHERKPIRESKTCEWKCYFDTFTEAKNYCILEAQKKIDILKIQLADAQTEYLKVIAITE